MVCNQEFLTSDKWSLALSLNALSFGYVVYLLICYCCRCTKYARKFFAGAFSPIILNTVLILVLLIGGAVLQMEMLDLAILLCLESFFWVLQLFMPAFQMRKLEGWQIRMDFSNSEEFGRIKALFWIGALGGTRLLKSILWYRGFLPTHWMRLEG